MRVQEVPCCHWPPITIILLTDVCKVDGSIVIRLGPKLWDCCQQARAAATCTGQQNSFGGKEKKCGRIGAVDPDSQLSESSENRFLLLQNTPVPHCLSSVDASPLFDSPSAGGQGPGNQRNAVWCSCCDARVETATSYPSKTMWSISTPRRDLSAIARGRSKRSVHTQRRS